MSWIWRKSVINCIQYVPLTSKYRADQCILRTYKSKTFLKKCAIDTPQFRYCLISSFFYFSSLFPSLDPFLPTRCRFLLHLITIKVTHTLVRTPLNEGSARRRVLYLTTNTTHKSYTSMPQRVSNPAGERARTTVLNRASTGFGCLMWPHYCLSIIVFTA